MLRRVCPLFLVSWLFVEHCGASANVFAAAWRDNQMDQELTGKHIKVGLTNCNTSLGWLLSWKPAYTANELLQAEWFVNLTLAEARRDQLQGDHAQLFALLTDSRNKNRWRSPGTQGFGVNAISGLVLSSARMLSRVVQQVIEGSRAQDLPQIVTPV